MRLSYNLELKRIIPTEKLIRFNWNSKHAGNRIMNQHILYHIIISRIKPIITNGTAVRRSLLASLRLFILLTKR